MIIINCLIATYESKSNKLLPRNASGPLLRLTRLQFRKGGVAEGGKNSPFSCSNLNHWSAPPLWWGGVSFLDLLAIADQTGITAYLPWSTYFHWQIPSSSECGAHPFAASRANGSQRSNDAFRVPFADSQLRKASCLSEFIADSFIHYDI